jgi:hypothetical protein
MAELEYSTEGKNVLHMFYGADKTLYVEGEDDIPFWEVVFEKFASFSVHIETAGGKENVVRYIDSISSGEADYLMALDSDYDYFVGEDVHPHVIKTYGYSIENTFITKASICKLIKNLAKIPARDVPEERCEFWIDHIAEAVMPLLVHDLFNRIEGMGVSIIPTNSDRFMVSNTSINLCSNKISKHIECSGLVIDADKRDECEHLITSSGRSSLDILRGHFYLSAVMRFIKAIVKDLRHGVTVSKDAFYAHFISVFEVTFCDEHPHYEYYKTAIAPLNTTH